MKEIGIAVVGAGRIGRMHAEIFAATPGASVVGVVDRKRKDPDWPARAGLRDAKIYASAEEAFADKAVDAAVIATSSDCHPELVRAAAAAGKKIFCEKPVAFSAAEIRALDKDIGSASVHVGLNRRMDPRFAALQKALAAGRLGRIYSYHIVNRDPKRPPPGFAARSGGMLADFNVHDFDMLRFLSGGEIAEVYVRGACLIDPEIEAAGDIDSAVIVSQMADGALASVCCTRETNYGYDQRIEALGEKGALRADNILDEDPVQSGESGCLLPPPRADFIARYRESFEAQARAFVAGAQEGGAYPCTLEDVACAVAVVEAGNESLKSGRPVKVAS